MQPNKTVLAIGAGTTLLAASLVAPSAARAYRVWEVERRQALIAASIDAARRGSSPHFAKRPAPNTFQELISVADRYDPPRAWRGNHR